MNKNKYLPAVLIIIVGLLAFYFLPLKNMNNENLNITEITGNQIRFEELIKNFNYKITGELSNVMWQKKSCDGFINNAQINKLENQINIVYYFEGKVGQNRILTKCAQSPNLSYTLYYFKSKSGDKIKIIKSITTENNAHELKLKLLNKYYEN